MDEEPPAVELELPGPAYKFHFPYRPSKILCYTLILWTILCIIIDAFAPYVDVVLTLTIYAPTIYFAVKWIRKPSQDADQSRNSDKMGKTVVVLFVLWQAIIPTHIYLSMIPQQFGVFFLIPLLPGSQSIILLFYLLLRVALDRRARKSPKLLDSTTDRQEAVPSVTDAESQSPFYSESQLLIYRPSKALLVVLLPLTISSWVQEVLFLSWMSRPYWAKAIWWGIAWGIALMCFYLPLIRLEIYTLKRAHRRCEPTLIDEGGMANYFMDLGAIFFATTPLVFLFILHDVGAIQRILLAYIAVRYAWNLLGVLPAYDGLNNSNNNPEAQIQEPPQEPLPEPSQVDTNNSTPSTVESES